jgi:hypothetical protein
MRFVLALLASLAWIGSVFALEPDRSAKGDQLPVPDRSIQAETLFGRPLSLQEIGKAAQPPTLERTFEYAVPLPGAPEPTVVPPADDADPLAPKAFRYRGESAAEFEQRERRCLATAIYFLSRDEPVRRQVAVGQVILNRMRSPRFPATICGVVYQDQMSPNCPLRFPCDGLTDNPRNDG